MSRILLYTTQFCGYCRAAKNLLRAKGLDYEEIDVGFDPATRIENRAGVHRLEAGGLECQRQHTAAVDVVNDLVRGRASRSR